MATIVIADDNSDIRELLAIRLKSCGFDCLLASNGYQVMEMLTANRVDMVLMDMNMPGQDGWMTTAQIRASIAHKKLPIIAITAYSMEGDRARALHAGCNLFHCKPLAFDNLRRDIVQLLESKRA